MAGAVCGVAGALFANLTLFVSPSIMHWTRSGEIMMMVILGGIGTLFGPVFGAAAYLILESVLSRLTEHWQAAHSPAGRWQHGRASTPDGGISDQLAVV